VTETAKTTRQKALKIRKRVKKGKPKFVRPESWRYFRLKESWRHPRGLDHKVRLMYKGWPPAAGSGYGGPKFGKGLHPSGYREVLVHNVEDLRKIDPDIHAARIASRVGKRKKAVILTEARKRKIVVLNVREVKKPVGKEPAEEELEEKVEETAETAKEEAPVEKGKKEEEKTKKSKGSTEKR
jgi:large subunit ribosomal protein L32e